MQERLIQFINNLTDEECEIIVSYLAQENAKQETPESTLLTTAV